MATINASLEQIYNRLNGIEPYHPLSADTFSDWSMEAGDIIRVTRDGKNYDSPVHASSMNWRGQPQISVSSGGNEKRENISRQTKRKYSRGGSGIRNDSFLHQSLRDAYNNLSSYFEVTESRMYASFWGAYDGLSGAFEVTRSRMRADFFGAYDGLSGSFEVTRSMMRADFFGAYDGLAGAFEATRSSMRADFYGAYDGLSGAFEVTRSQMRADFFGAYDGLSGHFEITRSLFNVQLNNYYKNLSAGIVASAQSVETYVQGATSRASIVAKINDKNDESQVLINADRITIGSYNGSSISLNDRVSIDESGNLLVSGNIRTSLSGSEYIQTKKIRLVGRSSSQGADIEELDTYDIQEMIVKADVDGNTLRLWKKGANTAATSGDGIINFSKATTLSPTWSSGNFPLTISASPQGVSKTVGFTNASDVFLEIDKNGTPTQFGQSRKLINVPYKVIHHAGQPVGDQTRYTGSIASVDATSVYTFGWEDCYDEVKLNYSSDQQLEYGKSITIYPNAKRTPTGEATNIQSKKITITAQEAPAYATSNPYIYIKNLANNAVPEGYTTRLSRDGWTFYRKGTSDGMDATYAFATAPRLDVDGQTLNADNNLWVVQSGSATALFRYAYNAVSFDGQIVSTAIDRNEIKSEDITYTAKLTNGKTDTTKFNLVYSTYTNQNTNEVKKCVHAYGLTYTGSYYLWTTIGRIEIPMNVSSFALSATDAPTAPSGFTKPSGKNYYIKDGTSGRDAVVRLYAELNAVIDNLSIGDATSDLGYLQSSLSDIYKDAYDAGMAASPGIQTAPTGTAIYNYGNYTSGTISADGMSSSFTLSAADYYAAGTSSSPSGKCVELTLAGRKIGRYAVTNAQPQLIKHGITILGATGTYGIIANPSFVTAGRNDGEALKVLAGDQYIRAYCVNPDGQGQYDSTVWYVNPDVAQVTISSPQGTAIRDGYTNNQYGYAILNSVSDANQRKAGIGVQFNLQDKNFNTISTLTSYLEWAPTNLYKKGYQDGLNTGIGYEAYQGFGFITSNISSPDATLSRNGFKNATNKGFKVTTVGKTYYFKFSD